MTARNLEDGCDWDQRTNCLLWKGPLGSTGHPVDYRAPDWRQRMAARERWAESYGIDMPRTIKLRRVCGRVLCVAPWHGVLARPLRVAAEEGASAWQLRAMRGLLRRLKEGDADWRICWAGGLRELCCAPHAVHKLAEEQDVSIWVVLAAYATLLPTQSRQKPPKGHGKKTHATGRTEPDGP